ncbi:MAG: gliding motility-associated C-terminal domain-containing protein [Lewinellaceae bacterium]|nr:gliding motility-associated C-terminal domain-containing protein [Lewinellaceae bacterium]
MKKELIAFVGLIVLTTASLRAQNCNETLNAGADATICQPGETVPLNATFSGATPLSVSWAPAAGVANPSGLQTTAAANATTTYTLTVRSVAFQNLIFNGNFSAGDNGFDSDYIYGTGGSVGLLTQEGQYAIATNPRNTHNQFVNCADHTGGNGNMMVVNGSGMPDSVWCQTVTVQPNTEYAFSAWVTSVVSQNPADLQFFINGFPLGPQYDAVPTTCNWQQFAQYWPSGSATSARICIVNVNENPAGNDFALDDISFSPVCEYQDSVTVTLSSPPPAPVVSCSSTTASIQLTWPSVPEASGYEVSVLNGPAGAFVNDTTYLLNGLDPDMPVDFEVTALSSGPCGNSTTSLSCSTAPCPELTVTLDGSDHVCLGDIAVFTLNINTTSTGPFSMIVNGGQFPFILNEVEPGATELSFNPTQSFTVTLNSFVDSSAPNCIYSDLPAPLFVEVNQPANAGEGGQAEACAGTETLFQLRDVLTGEDNGGTWSDISAVSSGSAFDPAAATVNPAQLVPGNYTYQYSVPGPMGCPASTSEVEITVLPAPVADAGQPQALNCSATSVTLGSGATSNGPEFQYSWEVIEGAALTNPSSSMPEAQAPGIYALSVANLQTGCRASDTTTVEEQITFPEPQLSAITGDCFIQGQAVISVDAVENGVEPYLFSLDGENYSASPQFFNLSEGNYTVYVIDGNQCDGSADITIEASNTLAVELVANSGESTPRINFGDSLLLRTIISADSAGIDSISWFPRPDNCNGCAQAFVNPEMTTTYTVTVTDIKGCRSSANLTVFVEQKYRYYIPNAFSPNEDGRNDVFFVNTGPEFQRVAALHILDRWGNMVYSKEDFPPNDPSFGWDGIFNGNLVPAGIYAFVAELELITGQVIVENGALTVVY